jgi:hypothetical protein
MYHTATLTQNLHTDWNYVISNSDETGLFHEIEMLDFLSKERNAENISFIVYDNAEPLAICPLYRYTYKNVFGLTIKALNSFGSVGAGPAFIRGLGGKKRRQLFYFLSVHFKDLVVLYRCDVFFTSVAILSKKYTEKPVPFVNPLLEMRGFKDVSHPYYYLDLRETEENLLKKVEKRSRLIIKKYQDHSDICIKTATLDDFENAWSLCRETFRRNNLPLIQKNLFTDYYLCRYSRLFIAYKATVPICLINCGLYRNTGLYWTLYIADKFMSSGIGVFMLWNSILDAKKKGVEHFYLGPQLFWEIGSKEDRIARYKRAFGGELRYRFMVRYEREGRILALARKIKQWKECIINTPELLT